MRALVEHMAQFVGLRPQQSAKDQFLFDKNDVVMTVRQQLAGRAEAQKNSFNTASYTIYPRFGHTLVRLEMALTGQNDHCPSCLISSFTVYYANFKLRKNVWF